MLLLRLLVDGLGLKWIDHLVLSHIDEHLAACLRVLRLHHEAFPWLDHCATFRINVWLSIVFLL